MARQKHIFNLRVRSVVLWLSAVVTILFLIHFASAYSYEPIPVTVSHTMGNVTFDGRWTFDTEWKASSLNIYSYDNGTQVILRSAHQGDFIYILVNPIGDQVPDRMEDYAVVCIDSVNDKSAIPDNNDYCFMSVLEGDAAAYRGGGNEEAKFEKISSPEGFMGVSSVSDHNDRYTSIPHPSYEFKIPTDLVGRESVYGFFLLVHDAHFQKTYTYPENVDPGDFVANPSQWGEIYSPDKSLPEFGFATLGLVASFAAIVLLARIKHRMIRY